MILESRFDRREVESFLRAQIKGYRIEPGRVVLLNKDGEDIIWIDEPAATTVGSVVNLDSVKFSLE